MGGATFEYTRNNYTWSLSVMGAINRGTKSIETVGKS